MKRFFLLALPLVLIGAGCAQDTTNLELTDGFSNDSGLAVEQVDETEPSSTSSFMNDSQTEFSFPGVLPAERIENKQVRISTEKGDVVIKLFADVAPMTVSNFVYLTEEGYYDGLTFHRVIENFMAQGGDPTGTGAGGPGYNFEDEIDSSVRFDAPGKLAMANRGPNTNGSQFFITTVVTDWLNDMHTIFGEVTEGQDVVEALENGDVMVKVTIEDQS